MKTKFQSQIASFQANAAIGKEPSFGIGFPSLLSIRVSSPYKTGLIRRIVARYLIALVFPASDQQIFGASFKVRFLGTVSITKPTYYIRSAAWEGKMGDGGDWIGHKGIR